MISQVMNTKNIYVVKIGSAAVTKGNLLNKTAIYNLCKEIVALTEEGNYEFVIVSSGAVAAGRGVLKTFTANTEAKRVYASVGQSELISSYNEAFKELSSNKISSQILVTRYDFSDRRRYVFLRETIIDSIKKNIIPIVNNNDVLYVEQHDFTDNDQLASYIAVMIDAEALILISDIDGIYDKSPKKHHNASMIRRLPSNYEEWPNIEIDSEMISNGGIQSKIEAAKLMSSFGIGCCITSSKQDRYLSRAINLELGTWLRPDKSKRKTGYKKWLAAGSNSQGILIVSALGASAMKNNKRKVSLLLIGLEKVFGTFRSGEIVTVRDEDYTYIGIGKVKYSSSELKDIKTKEKDVIIIHADFFFREYEGSFIDSDRSHIQQSILNAKGSGYQLTENSKGKITISLKKGGEKETVMELYGQDAEDAYKNAIKASGVFNITIDDWLLFSYFDEL